MSGASRVGADARETLRSAQAALASAQASVAAGGAALARATERLVESDADLEAAKASEAAQANASAYELNARAELAETTLSVLVDQGALVTRARARRHVSEIARDDAQIRLGAAQRELEQSKRDVAAAITNVLMVEAEALGELIEGKTTELVALQAKLGGRYDFASRHLPLISKRLQKVFFAVDDGPVGQTGSPARRAAGAAAEAWAAFVLALESDADATLKF